MLSRYLAYEKRAITYCKTCGTLPACLVHQGFFPSTPSQPRIAFALDLLKFNLRVSSVTKTSTQAMAEGLRGNIEDTGTYLIQKNAFLDQLQNLLPWFDAFLRRVERLVDHKIRDQTPLVRATALTCTRLAAQIVYRSHLLSFQSQKCQVPFPRC
jgi:hypothetical protein